MSVIASVYVDAATIFRVCLYSWQHLRIVNGVGIAEYLGKKVELLHVPVVASWCVLL